MLEFLKRHKTHKCTVDEAIEAHQQSIDTLSNTVEKLSDTQQFHIDQIKEAERARKERGAA